MDHKGCRLLSVSVASCHGESLSDCDVRRTFGVRGLQVSAPRMSDPVAVCQSLAREGGTRREMEREMLKMISIRELAGDAKVSQRTVERAISNGDLPAFKVGSRTLIDSADARDWLTRNPVQVTTRGWVGDSDAQWIAK